MLNELEAETPGDFAIVGINAIGLESTNSLVVDRTLPWLQDTNAAGVWGAWQAAWRDVVLVDKKNAQLGAPYNLFDHDLNDPAAYAELKQRFLDAR